MEPIFAEYPCAIIVDDIIIGGNGIKEHDDNLKRVLDQARPVNLRLIVPNDGLQGIYEALANYLFILSKSVTYHRVIRKFDGTLIWFR